MATVFRGLLVLMRPANLPTAVADVLAGAAIAGFFTGTSLVSPLLYLIGSTLCLYAGGVVLNDVFDVEIDQVERPERPIPSGQVPLGVAGFFGFGLLGVGCILAFMASNLAGNLGLALALAILAYDGFSKRFSFLGPLNMGLCRALNLLMGMAVLGALNQPWLAVLPLCYIFAITMISRGEVHGENRKQLLTGGVLYALVIFGIALAAQGSSRASWAILPVLAVFAYNIYRPLVRAYQENQAGNIMKAVKAGVISLVFLDACLALAYGPWWAGLLVLLLWPVSVGLAKLFAVT